MEPINTLRGQNAELPIVKGGFKGTYSYHYCLASSMVLFQY
jgi:hypothetical protein